MERFLVGLAAGLLGSVITNIFTSAPEMVIGVGLTIACLIWFGELILDWF
jgi:CHASE2 domain-containing sensor protein